MKNMKDRNEIDFKAHAIVAVTMLLIIIGSLAFVKAAHADPNVAKCATFSGGAHSSVAEIQSTLIKRADVLNTHNHIIAVVNHFNAKTGVSGVIAKRIVAENMIYTDKLGFTPALSGPINYQLSSESQCVAELDKQLNLLAVAESHTHHGSMTQFFLAALDAGWFN